MLKLGVRWRKIKQAVNYHTGGMSTKKEINYMKTKTAVARQKASYAEQQARISKAKAGTTKAKKKKWKKSFYLPKLKKGFSITELSKKK